MRVRSLTARRSKLLTDSVTAALPSQRSCCRQCMSSAPGLRVSSTSNINAITDEIQHSRAADLVR
eukprot:2746750-Pleurochrysis_carterae.AAC.1